MHQILCRLLVRPENGKQKSGKKNFRRLENFFRPTYNCTAKNTQLTRSLLTSSNGLVINNPISGCVRMASFQKICCKLIKTCYPQACCKLFQQIVTSLQMTSSNKPDFNRLLNLMKLTSWNLLTSCNKPVKLKNCNKSVAFLGCVV